MRRAASGTNVVRATPARTAESPATANRPRRPMWSCSSGDQSLSLSRIDWQVTPLVIPPMIAAGFRA